MKINIRTRKGVRANEEEYFRVKISRRRREAVG